MKYYKVMVDPRLREDDKERVVGKIRGKGILPTTAKKAGKEFISEK